MSDLEFVVKVLLGFALLGAATWLWGAMITYIQNNILPEFGIGKFSIGGVKVVP